MRRRAFTLVEMLIAMALTLILVVAISEFYAFLGETVKDGRASIEMQGQLRGASQRLKTDLGLVTLPIVPWADDGFAPGYFCIAEGRGNDWDANGNDVLDEREDVNSDGELDLAADGVTNMVGDGDDWLAFTARANGDEPWVGQLFLVRPDGTLGYPDPMNPNVLLEGPPYEPRPDTSRVAEIAWWTSFGDTDGDSFWDLGEPRFIHRRSLLIRPDLNVFDAAPPPDAQNPNPPPEPYCVRVRVNNIAEANEAFFTLLQNADLSVRPLKVANGYAYFTANALSDLTRRENRFMNIRGAFPNRLDLNPRFAGDSTQPRASAANTNAQYRWVLDGDRKGEDVVLSNVLAFDVRVFDPAAPLARIPPQPPDQEEVLVQPGDPGWGAMGATIEGQGAFVDLFYHRYAAYNAGSRFSHPMATASQMADTNNQALLAYFDTWAQSYERDGMNQDNDTETDEGTDGLDSLQVNPANPMGPQITSHGVDNAEERETAPPYGAPLRGIQVKVRLYEPGTRQARQATVGADFLAE